MTGTGTRVLLLLGALLLVKCGNALDVVVTKISCDSTLPISVSRNNFAVTCSGEKQCTFGELATLQGQLQYQQVKYLDLKEDSIVYMTVYFDVSVDLFDIPDGTAMNLCDDSVKPVTVGATCPSDGRYNFNVTFLLPYYYSESWWATGWHDSGHINIYADNAEEHLIGSCELYYTTKVTSSYHFFHAPSAAFIVDSFVGIFLVICLYYSARDFYCVWKEDHLELHCGRKCCPADKCVCCGQDYLSNDDYDDDVYHMEYNKHGESVKSVYQLSDLHHFNDANDEDNVYR